GSLSPKLPLRTTRHLYMKPSAPPTARGASWLLWSILGWQPNRTSRARRTLTRLWTGTRDESALYSKTGQEDNTEGSRWQNMVKRGLEFMKTGDVVWIHPAGDTRGA